MKHEAQVGTYKSWGANLHTLSTSCAVAELGGFPTDNHPLAAEYGIPALDIPFIVKGMVEDALSKMENDLYMGGHPGLLIAVTSPNQTQAREELKRNGFVLIAAIDNPVYTRAETGQSKAETSHICHLLMRGVDAVTTWRSGAKGSSLLFHFNPPSPQESADSPETPPRESSNEAA